MTRATPPIKLAIHGAIYEWARPFAAGADVLDLGCAEGFGAAVLADAARQVVAVDWDGDLVAEAGRRNGRPNIEFRTGDCQQPMGVAAFDLVVNNALLEHVDDAEALMASAARALRPGGLMICGTKNSNTSFKQRDGSPLYDNHLREYTAASLADLLCGYLVDIRLHAVLMSSRARSFLMHPAAVGAEGLLVRLGVKSMIPPTLRNWVRGAVTGVRLSDLAPADFLVTESSPAALDGEMRDATYLLATGRRDGESRM